MAARSNSTIESDLAATNELRLSPRLNLCESGLCRLEHVKALQQKAHNPAHVAWGTRTKRSVSALIHSSHLSAMSLFQIMSYQRMQCCQIV
jgi:hypothetical protein